METQSSEGNKSDRKADIAIVELETNSGDTPSAIKNVMRTIKTQNNKAPVYWMNIGALGH